MRTIILMLLFFPLSIQAQNENTTENAAYIEVTGSAEKEIAPNIIYIRIILQETVDKNKVLIEEQETSLKTKLKENGFDLNLLRLKNANSIFFKSKRRPGDVINRREYSLKVSNSVEVTKAFKILDEVNVKDASITETSHTDIQVFRKEVKRLALQAAKEKATELLNAIGESIGEPLIIKELEENNYSQPSQLYANIVAANSINEYTSDDDDLELKPIRMKYMMFARFKIK